MIVQGKVSIAKIGANNFAGLLSSSLIFENVLQGSLRWAKIARWPKPIFAATPGCTGFAGPHHQHTLQALCLVEAGCSSFGSCSTLGTGMAAGKCNAICMGNEVTRYRRAVSSAPACFQLMCNAAQSAHALLLGERHQQQQSGWSVVGF